MAYDSAVAPLKKFLDVGFPTARSTESNAISAGSAMHIYCSSHAGNEITGTGFFTGVAASPASSTGTLHPSIRTAHPNALGVKSGDLVLNVESSAGATPGRATWHVVTNSTWSGHSTAVHSSTMGYDASVSAHAST